MSKKVVSIKFCPDKDTTHTLSASAILPNVSLTDLYLTILGINALHRFCIIKKHLRHTVALHCTEALDNTILNLSAINFANTNLIPDVQIPRLLFIQLAALALGYAPACRTAFTEGTEGFVVFGRRLVFPGLLGNLNESVPCVLL